MTITSHQVTAHLPIGIAPATTTPLEVKSSTIAFDEKWSPFIQQTLVCKLPLDGNAHLFTNPALGQRVVTEVKRFNADGSSYQELSLSLAIRTTSWDYNAGELTITAESDESLLQDVVYAVVPGGYPALISSTMTAKLTAAFAYQPLLAGATIDSTGYSNPSVITDSPDPRDRLGATVWNQFSASLEKTSSRCWSEGGGKFFIRDHPYVRAGEVTLGVGNNAKRANQDLTRDGNLWADGVLIVYRWKDTSGVDQIDTDVAYTGAGALNSTKWVVFNRTGPAPAGNAAQPILDRLQQRAAAVVIEAVADYTVRPSQVAHVTLPDSEFPFDTHTSRVEFRHPENTMTVTMRSDS